VIFPEDLIEAFDSRNDRGVVAFVGSGPSIHCGLPTWPELLLELAGAVGLEEEVGPSLGDGRFLDVAQFLARTKSESALQERVGDIFRRRRRGPGALHELIVEIPFSGVVTTNYDLLISDADRQGRFERPISHRTSGLGAQLKKRFVFHVHGHIEDPASIVLTKQSYDRFAAGIQRETLQFLRSVFQMYVVLFIGFGFRDQNVDMMLREMHDLAVVTGWNVYALVPFKDPARPDRVLESALLHRSVNPIPIAEGGDHGAGALGDWLASLGRAINAMTRSRLRPFVEEPQFKLAAGLKDLLTSAEYEPLLRTALGKLPDRPDLQRAAQRRLDSLSFVELLGRVDKHEARLIFVELNRAKRDPGVEELLSALPPIKASY
jgi:hypothetical protein